MANQTAMEKWKAWVSDVASDVLMISEFHEKMRCHYGIRLALEAAKEIGVLESEKWVEGLSSYPLYRINLDALEEDDGKS